MPADPEDAPNELNRQSRELSTIRAMLTQVITYIRDAESEIPERVRRFMNYFHDLRDIRFMYEEHGITAPDYIDREIERCHDRYKHILDELNAEGGAFNKVRRDMAERGGNRYDHTRLLTNGAANETGPSKS